MNPEVLHQLFYLSDREAHLTDHDVVNDIVLPSILRNRSRDISGCLWFNQLYFMQILEGSTSDIFCLFDRIASDPRHEKVQLIAEYPIARRSFQRFQMRTIPMDLPDSVKALVDIRDFGLSSRRVGGAAVRLMLREALADLDKEDVCPA